MKKVLFTGGGSAGHVVPNLPLIKTLLCEGVRVGYIGTDGIEKKLLAEYDIPFFTIRCPKLIRGMSLTNLKENVKIPFRFHQAKREALDILTTFQPHLVFSKGGYVALPVVFSAHRLGIPCLAHESDFSIGLANRLSAKKCQRIFTAFPETAKTIPNGEYSGNILRPSLQSRSFLEARKYFSIPTNKKVVLFFGGGSGSEKINEAVRNHIKILVKNYVILHVCGKGKRVDCDIKGYHQFEFIKDMGMAYACADFVVSRSGSNTLFEILSLKKPAVLIPLEGATRGDQLQNAQYFERKGVCRILRQSDLALLPKALDLLSQDNELLKRLNNLSLPIANERILKKIREFLS